MRKGISIFASLTVEHMSCSKHYHGRVYGLVKDNKNEPVQMTARGGRDTGKGRNRDLGA